MSTTGLAETALPPDIFRGLQPIRSDAERATAAWNAAMANQAVALEAQGVSPRDIFLQTRTWRGQDGKLRQEAFAALPERRASTMPGFGQPSVPGEFLGGFVGGPQRFSVMDPEAQRLQAARDVGQQASVASELYGAASPFAIASTMARRGQMMGVSPLTVFQGSPHRFTKLDSSKIGTGEGAQMYGYGLYFAENPAFAKQYAISRGIPDLEGIMYQQGLPRVSKDVEREVARLAATDKDPMEAAKYVQFANREARAIERKDLAKVIDEYRRQSKGVLYTIDLPDRMIDRMLDWDKPLREQPTAVQELTQRLRSLPGDPYNLERYFNPKNPSKGPLGQEIYRAISKHFEIGDDDAWEDLGLTPDQTQNIYDAASRYSAKLGIHGIKYRNQEGTGTRNFVVFPGEEEALTILSRD